jgi:hypothetical protein
MDNDLTAAGGLHHRAGPLGHLIVIERSEKNRKNITINWSSKPRCLYNPSHPEADQFDHQRRRQRPQRLFYCDLEVKRTTRFSDKLTDTGKIYIKGYLYPILYPKIGKKDISYPFLERDILRI